MAHPVYIAVQFTLMVALGWNVHRTEILPSPTDSLTTWLNMYNWNPSSSAVEQGCIFLFAVTELVSLLLSFLFHSQTVSKRVQMMKVASVEQVANAHNVTNMHNEANPRFLVRALRKGSITVITGPMFAGKTKALQTILEREQLGKKTTVCIAYADDNRYSCDSVLCTHDKRMTKADFKVASLMDIPIDVIEKADSFLVDEFQFFPDAVDWCVRRANEGKRVFVAGLNGTYKQTPFVAVSKLSSCAEHFIHLTAVCDCGEDAHFTILRKPTLDSSDDVVKKIGGSQEYQAVCRACMSQRQPSPHDESKEQPKIIITPPSPDEHEKNVKFIGENNSLLQAPSEFTFGSNVKVNS